jgi:DNA-3-methyladenine glycosylase II
MAAPISSEFGVALAGPIDVPASLDIFRRSGDDMLDRWDGTWLVRTIRVGGRVIAYTCRAEGTLDTPVLRVTAERVVYRDAVENAVRTAFLPLTTEFEELCRIDPVITRLNQRHRGFRPVMQSDLLGALVRCISAQQVNLKWASTVRSRLAESFGWPHRVAGQVVYSLDPERLAALTIPDIRALQFTNRKAEYIINAARAIATGELSIETLSALSDDEVIARITAIRGLGVWTAEWILARTLGRPRVSAGDLGVRKAVGAAYLNGRMPSPDEVREATAHWGAAAALAQGLLLHAQHEKTLVPHAALPKKPAPLPRKRAGAKRRIVTSRA